MGLLLLFLLHVLCNVIWCPFCIIVHYRKTVICIFVRCSFILLETIRIFRLLTDFVCLLTYEFCLSLWKVARCSVILLLPLCILLGTDHLTWRGGSYGFFVSFRNFFSDNTRIRIFFFCRAKRKFFFQNLTLGYM